MDARLRPSQQNDPYGRGNDPNFSTTLNLGLLNLSLRARFNRKPNLRTASTFQISDY